VSFRRAKWVIPWLALRAKTNPPGVAADQASIIEAVGERRNV